MLLGVLKGLIHRAHVICDEKQDLLEELELLRNVFICNGYPEHLVSATLKAKGSICQRLFRRAAEKASKAEGRGLWQ